LSFYSTYRLSFFFSVLYFSHREYTSNSEEPNDIQESDINMNRRINAPPVQMNQNSGQPVNFNRQQTAPAKKTVQHDTDVYV